MIKIHKIASLLLVSMLCGCSKTNSSIIQRDGSSIFDTNSEITTNSSESSSGEITNTGSSADSTTSEPDTSSSIDNSSSTDTSSSEDTSSTEIEELTTLVFLGIGLSPKGESSDELSCDLDVEYYLHIYLDNPDSFEIYSLTLNNIKYASYMFEKGSSLDDIIIKFKAPNQASSLDYSITEIKYFDGVELKILSLEENVTTIHFAHVHKFSNEWTGNDEGHYHASTCGHSVSSEIVPHTYGEWTIESAPSLYGDGNKTRECSVCGYVQNESIPLDDDAEVHISLWTHFGYDQRANIESVIDAFEAEHQSIDIDLEYQGSYSELEYRLLMASTAGNTDNVIVFSSINANKLEKYGQEFIDLSSFINDEEYYSGTIGSYNYRYNDKQVGLPIMFSKQLYVYNKDTIQATYTGDIEQLYQTIDNANATDLINLYSSSFDQFNLNYEQSIISDIYAKNLLTSYVYEHGGKIELNENGQFSINENGILAIENFLAVTKNKNFNFEDVYFSSIVDRGLTLSGFNSSAGIGYISSSTNLEISSVDIGVSHTAGLFATTPRKYSDVGNSKVANAKKEFISFVLDNEEYMSKCIFPGYVPCNKTFANSEEFKSIVDGYENQLIKEGTMKTIEMVNKTNSINTTDFEWSNSVLAERYHNFIADVLFNNYPIEIAIKRANT